MKNIKLIQGDLITITWLDAFGKGSWNNFATVEDGLKNHIQCEITGYYVTKDKNFIVLSMGFQTDPQSNPFLHLEYIPQGCVQEIKKLNQ